jgi:[CysO sulfur-carrier protein]-S-L-cysteine hydrolase
MIRIPKAIYDQMITHAKKSYPNEACGILAGKSSDSVSEFYAMRNMDESSISYFMDPREQLLIFKKMRASATEMNAIFHSHVASEAFPSQKDVRLAFYPDVSYLIVSLTDIEKPILRSYKIKDETVNEEDIQIV